MKELKILDDVALDREIRTRGHLAVTVVYFLDSCCRRRRHYSLVVAEAAAADGLGLRPAATVAAAAAAATFQLLLNDELLENGKNTPVGRVLLQLMDGLLVLAESSFTGAGADADVLVTGVFVVALSSSPSITSRLRFTFPARLLTGRRGRAARLVMSTGVDKCT